jgi:hypothetical protein
MLVEDSTELEALRKRLAQCDRDVVWAKNEVKRQEARVENARRWGEERESEFQQLERENASLCETNAAQLTTILQAREIIGGQGLSRLQLLIVDELLD